MENNMDISKLPKSVQTFVLINDFAQLGGHHAELVMKKHQEQYCVEGKPFLSCENESGEGSPLEEYAVESFTNFVEGYLSTCHPLEVVSLMAEFDFGMLGTVYTSTFIPRYQELLPGKEEEVLSLSRD